MYRDTKEALARLEKELFSEDKEKTQRFALPRDAEDGQLEAAIDNTLQDQAPGEHPGGYVNYANGYGCDVYNTDTADVDLEDYSQQVLEPKKERLSGLWVLLFALLACNLAVMGFWILRLLGVLG